MDPFTHTLLGAVLADTGLKRRTSLAAATLVVGANLPDVDVFAYAVGSDAALACRRGDTHGVLALVVLPLLLTAGILAYDHLRRRGWAPAAVPAVPRQVLLLATLAVATHPLLDFLNTYGVRLLMPFDGRWFYGDALFIVDPWIWLLLGGTLFWNHSTTVRGLRNWTVVSALASLAFLGGSGPHDEARWLWTAGLVGWALLRWRRGVGDDRAQRRRARAAVAAAAAYAAAMIATTLYVEGLVRAELPALGVDEVERFMVGPVVVDPLTREVVIQTPDVYLFATFHWLARPQLRLDPRRVPRTAADGDRDAPIAAALGASCVRGMVGWMRFPFFEVDDVADGWVVHLLDARYVRHRTRGFGAAAVHVPRDPAAGAATCPSPD